MNVLFAQLVIAQFDGVNVYNYGEYMKIDKEFQSLIFPLSNDEYILLEQNIIRDGCRDALVVWKEEDILLDGHNRYKICQKHKIDYKIKIISLSDRATAEDWIDSNQLGRRNLSPDMMRLIRGRLYNRLKEAKGGDIRTKIPKGQNEPLALSRQLPRPQGAWLESTIAGPLRIAMPGDSYGSLTGPCSTDFSVVERM
jgi:hypothetical protein